MSYYTTEVKPSRPWPVINHMAFVTPRDPLFAVAWALAREKFPGVGLGLVGITDDRKQALFQNYGNPEPFIVDLPSEVTK